MIQNFPVVYSSTWQGVEKDNLFREFTFPGHTIGKLVFRHIVLIGFTPSPKVIIALTLPISQIDLDLEGRLCSYVFGEIT